MAEHTIDLTELWERFHDREDPWTIAEEVEKELDAAEADGMIETEPFDDLIEDLFTAADRGKLRDFRRAMEGIRKEAAEQGVAVVLE